MTNLVNYEVFPECNCRVHEGFQLAIDMTHPQVMEAISALSAEHPTAKVKVSGHSLGGALATLSSMKLIASGVPVTTITMGQPRVGDFDFADFANTIMPEFVRIVNYKDYAPHGN